MSYLFKKIVYLSIPLLLFFFIILPQSNKSLAQCFPGGVLHPHFPVCQQLISGNPCVCFSAPNCVQTSCPASPITEDCAAYNGSCAACISVNFTGPGYCAPIAPNPNRCNWNGLFFCPANCTTGAIGCSACAGGSPGANACGNATGSQTCTHNQPQVCINTSFSRSCVHFVNNCNSVGYSGFTCNGANVCVNTISGRVWPDTNNNGIIDPGETGIGGITVQDSNSGVTAVTNAAGNYTLNGLRSGAHNLSIIAGIPAGFKQSPRTPNPKAYNQTSTINGANFAIVPVFTISGTVYNDYNANAIKDAGEIGLPNVTVTATSAVDSGSAVSIANGTFIITNLSPGTYSFSISGQPAGYVSNPNPLTQTVTIGPNSANNTIAVTRLYAISGNVYNDLNKDAHYNGGDSAFTAGNTIAHIVGGPNNITLDTTPTANGTFTSNNTLFAGTYTVTLTSPSPLPGGYTLEYPPGASYSVTIGDPLGNPACNTGTPTPYNDTACSLTGDLSGVNFALNNENAWFQFGPVSGLSYTASGDVRDDSVLGFQDLIPAAPVSGPYVVLQ